MKIQNPLDLSLIHVLPLVYNFMELTKCLIVSKTLVRTKLKFYPFWENWGLISIFGPIGPKLEKSV